MVRPGLAGVAGLAGKKGPRLRTDRRSERRIGDTLTLQLSASGPSPIIYRMFPEPAIASQVTLDANTGLFTFSPTDDQVHRTFEITFQACVPDGTDCSATVQLHETIHIEVGPPPGGSISCPDYVPTVPTPAPNSRAPTSCPTRYAAVYVIKKGGTDPWIFNDVNILQDGAL